MGVRTNFALFDVTFKADVFLRVFLYHALFPFSIPIVVMREGRTFARNLSLYPFSPRDLLRTWVETMGFLINVWGILALTVFRRDLHPILLLILTYQVRLRAAPPRSAGSGATRALALTDARFRSSGGRRRA